MKKGFTLVELLGVIVILSIIGVIVMPLVVGVINDSEEKANDIQETMIRRAAKNYVQSKVYALNSKCEEDCEIGGCDISINDLKDAGYLDMKDLKNAKTNKEIQGTDTVKVCKDKNKYKYIYSIE